MFRGTSKSSVISTLDIITHLNLKESTFTRSDGDRMHHLGNYEKNHSIYTGCDKKVPCHILQNFKQRLKIFGWNLRTLQFLAFKQARFTNK